MERVRQAMEIALKEHWVERPIVREPAAPLQTPPRRVSMPPSDRAQSGRRSPETFAAPRPPPKPRQQSPSTPTRWRSAVPVVTVDDRIFEANRLIAALEEHPQREHYFLLQSTVAERLASSNIAVLGVTRPSSGRGKTLTASNLAISLAIDADREVLLVDLDLGAAKLHGLFGLDAGPGIEGALFNGVEPASLLRCPSIDRLVLLTAKGGSQAVAQVLRSSAPKALLATLRRQLPDAAVIVNLPSLASRDDAVAAGALVDAVLLVAEEDVTKEADYAQLLAGFGGDKIIGTVLNKS